MNCKICGKAIKGKYQKCNSIGMGSYSSVYLVCNSDEPKYIIKNLFDKDDSEYETCIKINDLNILSSKYVDKEDDKIIYTYVSGDSLNNYIYGYYDTDLFLKLISNLVNQLCLLEKQNFYHLDVNLSNIIIKDNKPYLIDFGTLTNKNDKLKREYYGSFGYVPPEYLLQKNLVIEKFDVFSIGIILFQKCFGFNPFNLSKYYSLDCWFWCKNSSCKDRGKCLLKYMESNVDNRKIIKIISKCLKFDPNKRISLSELNDELNN